jgi:hypothetical protein
MKIKYLNFEEDILYNLYTSKLGSTYNGYYFDMRIFFRRFFPAKYTSNFDLHSHHLFNFKGLEVVWKFSTYMKLE